MDDPVWKLSRMKAIAVSSVLTESRRASWMTCQPAERLPRADDDGGDETADPAHTQTSPLHVRGQKPGKKSPGQTLRRSSQIAQLTDLLTRKDEALLAMTESRDFQAPLTREMEGLWLTAKSRTRAKVALKLKAQSDFQSQVHYIIYLKMKHEDEVTLLKEEGRIKDETIGQLKNSLKLVEEELAQARAHLESRGQASGSGSNVNL
ncbi:uncharacterized protein LOC122022558 [Zingiber officinale]|uniref:uncharacterized protein LOC122022558 n=1 Tax=Zingiber officinale TaxID=94328 RepID=UPI001C4AFE7F|nr:uncharacterized protein LOC122022558 [Zingiber officinale]